MEITINRGGGFTGLREQLGPVDTASLGDAGSKIEEKVREIGFFEMEEELSGGRDNRPWSLFAIEDGERRHSVDYSAGTDSPEVRSLQALAGLLLEAGARFELSAGAAEDDGVEAGDTFGWGAWYNRMPGIDDPDLHVTGTCRLRSSSASVSLELGNVGIVPEPGVVVLKLTIEYPEGNGTDDMEDRPIEWRRDVGPDVKRVRVVGDTDVEIEVVIAT